MPKLITSGVWGLLAWTVVEAVSPQSARSAAVADTIYRDVAIIGGGASGSYSAVRLREDYNLSVVLIEKSGMLGGHVNTWVDPATGRGYDAGVQNFIDIGPARAFFTRMGVATASNVRSSASQVYVDFSTGVKLANYTTPAAEDRTAALSRYLAVTEQYLPIMEPGWWTFPGPKDIPADLMLPFRDFIAKHNLTAGLPTIFAATGFGMSDLLGGLTLWVMRSFSYNMCRTIMNIDTAFVPTSRKNQEVYDAILKLLGSDVLLSSTVFSAKRTEKDGVVLEVRDANGIITRVVAKRLLFTPTPNDEAVAPFDLDTLEKSTLGAFDYSTSFVGVVSHPSLPVNTSFHNIPSAAQPDNWIAAIPKTPFNTRFDNFPNSSYYRVIAVGDKTLGLNEARKIVSDSFDKLVEAGTIKQTDPPQPLTFQYFEPHGLVSAYASRKDLESGFIQRLNSLQGRRSTWYTGASWGVHLTTSLWIFTETVLPKLVASLKG